MLQIEDLKTGCLPFRPLAVPLHLSDYVDRKTFPRVPQVYGHVHSAGPPGSWGMLGNDTAGDCVEAGYAHSVMTWHWATGRPIPRFTDKVVKEQYFRMTGGPDVGLDPVKAANWWRDKGITDADGNVHKIAGFASVARFADLDIAAYLYGCVGMLLLMSDTAKQEFIDGKPWADTSVDPGTIRSGHYVPLVGRNSANLRIGVTWARNQGITAPWLERYLFGAIVCFSSEDYILQSGKSPEGLDVASLRADLTAFS